jgi:outer membrane protein OmpA-like peptidoglycan-associated protein
VGRGDTTIDLNNSGLIARATGQAKVQAKPGVTTVEAQVQSLARPTLLGAEFLTYVLWAVSPDGRAINLGEILPDNNGNGKLKATTQLQSFSLFVTAEPYAAVRQPSEMLVLENDLRRNTKGKIFIVRRTQYDKLGNPLALSLDLKNVPLEMYQARNAVDIARSRGAVQYAPDIFGKAEGGLKMAEDALARKANKKDVISLARQAAQFSEDARALAVERQEQEHIAAERAAAAAQARAEAEAKAAVEAAEARRKADEEAQRQAQQAAAQQAATEEEAKHQAELAEAREAQMKAEAAAKQAQMRAEGEITAANLRAREEAAKQEADRAVRAAEQLRAQLLAQFNRILETRDTVRGLVITVGDVLFDTGKYDLRMNARELLAKISGIVLAHPGLHLDVEGHTDSVGGEELNQRLSEKRADTVRNYLIGQGLAGEGVTARGFGEKMPVASNDTISDRQRNRRVELVVSGEVIGVKIGR